MQYFTVKVIDHPQPEIDIPLNQFTSLVAGIETELRAQGIFEADEKLLTRLVPRFEAMDEPIRVNIFNKYPRDLGELTHDIYLELKPSAPQQPMRGLSLWFCSPVTERICSVDLPVNWLFRAVYMHLHERLKQNQPSEVEKDPHFIVMLQEHGHIPKEVLQKSQGPRTYLAISAAPTSPEMDQLSQAISDQPAIEVSITERESLLEPATVSWQDYKPRLIGSRQRGDLRILLNYQVVQQLEQLAKETIPQKAEVAGLLIGNIYQAEKDDLFLDIDNIFIPDQTTKSLINLGFDQNAWQQLFATAEKIFPDKRVVGWYHTHLFKTRRLQPVASFDRQTKATHEVVNISTFFSKEDMYIHQYFFPKFWQVALAIELRESNILFYQWKRDKLALCQGFYVYEQTP